MASDSSTSSHTLRAGASGGTGIRGVMRPRAASATRARSPSMVAIEPLSASSIAAREDRRLLGALEQPAQDPGHRGARGVLGADRIRGDLHEARHAHVPVVGHDGRARHDGDPVPRPPLHRQAPVEQLDGVLRGLGLGQRPAPPGELLERQAGDELAGDVGDAVRGLTLVEHRDRLSGVELHGRHAARLPAQRLHRRAVAGIDHAQGHLAVEWSVAGHEDAAGGSPPSSRSSS